MCDKFDLCLINAIEHKNKEVIDYLVEKNLVKAHRKDLIKKFYEKN